MKIQFNFSGRTYLEQSLKPNQILIANNSRLELQMIVTRPIETMTSSMQASSYPAQAKGGMDI
jgi:hypothetical protein